MILVRTDHTCLRVGCHTYPSRAHESVDSNLAAAREVLRVVDELLMNPINFYVDDPSHLINGCSD
jgi:hypothetical protein